MRAQLRDVLDRAGYETEAITSTYRCMARAVAEPADLIILGLAGLADAELAVITALKAEPKPPRIVITFATNRRELAVQALEAGADAYLLEPFYAAEVRQIAAGVLGASNAATPSETDAPAQADRPAQADPGPLRTLAHEVAHAVNNPLQIVRLLLDKKHVTKKQLEEELPPQIERIDQVIGMLREFGAFAEAAPARADTGAHIRAAAEKFDITAEGEADAFAKIDPAHYEGALTALFATLRERAGKKTPLVARTESDGIDVVVSVAVDAAAFEGTDINVLRDSVFVIGEDREIKHGLALAATLMSEQGGSLEIHQGAGSVVFEVRAPAA